MAATTTIPTSRPIKVVGIGGSAGGLEAFSRLFAALPAHTGLAYVLVPHLSPTHPSELTHLMARVAPFPVTQAGEGDRLRPDHLYVLPADKMLQIVDGQIQLSPRPPRDGAPTVIDACFTSLADCRSASISPNWTGGSASCSTRALVRNPELSPSYQ